MKSQFVALNKQSLTELYEKDPATEQCKLNALRAQIDARINSEMSDSGLLSLTDIMLLEKERGTEVPEAYVMLDDSIDDKDGH